MVPPMFYAQVPEAIRYSDFNVKKHVDGIKGDKAETPTTYLGAGLKLRQINGTKCWTMSSHAYVQAAVKNVQEK